MKNWISLPPKDYRHELSDLESAHIREEARGQATVETFALFHDRDGEAVGGVVFGKLEDGSRCLAKLPDDKSVFQAIMSEEFIGKCGKIGVLDGFNIFKP